MHCENFNIQEYFLRMIKNGKNLKGKSSRENKKKSVQRIGNKFKLKNGKYVTEKIIFLKTCFL